MNAIADNNYTKSWRSLDYDNELEEKCKENLKILFTMQRSDKI